MTLKNEVSTQNNGVMDPFLKGHGESRYTFWEERFSSKEQVLGTLCLLDQSTHASFKPFQDRRKPWQAQRGLSCMLDCG